MSRSASAPIVVGVDGSQSSVEALRAAARLSEALAHPIEVVIAWQWPPLSPYFSGDWAPEHEAAALLEAALTEAFGSHTPDGLTRIIQKGSAALVLVEESRRAEMLVVGSRGRGGFAGLLLGSVSAQCVEHARCPVLVVHSPARPAA